MNQIKKINVIEFLISFVKSFFSRGHERTLLAKRNIAISFLFKVLSISIGLIVVPMTINYLNPTKYGVWVTLSSLIGWFGFFDIGLGNGLRNKFAESVATGRHELARVYVSTTYAILSLIVLVFYLSFYFINSIINWNDILNAGSDVAFARELSVLALVLFAFFSLQFVLKIITTILIADQRPAKAAFFDLLGQAIALFVIYILTKKSVGSLLYLGIAMSGSPVLVLIISSVWFYNGKYRSYRPSIKMVDFSQAKNLLKLGVEFFVIQIAAVLLYQTNNIIISQLFGPEHVTPYSVAFKYFSILMMVFSIVIAPFWSAFTEAWVKNETIWMKNIMSKLMVFWVVLSLMGLVMLFGSKFMYKVWVGDKVSISYSMSALVCLWVLLNAWNSIYSNFLNGLGKVRLQLFVGISGAILNVPLALYWGSIIGINGVLCANVLVCSVAAFIYPIQYKKIITNDAKGIWDA